MTQDLHLHDPQTLYRHWESGQWSPFAIDLAADRQQWREMSGDIEATLGLTAFRFITDHLEREDLLPGFVEGYSRIHHDEQRHIGYGVWYLRAAIRASPALAERVRATLAGLLAAVAESLTPPDREGTDWAALGASSQEIREFALDGLTRRLRIIGVSLDASA